MKKMNRLLSAILAVILMLSLLAGCSSNQANNEGNSPDGTSEGGELEGDIVFWHSFTQGPRLEKIQAAADEFMELHPKVNITIETFSWADFYTKWTTGLASGNVPDISSTIASQLVEMIDAGAVIPVDDLIDEVGRDRFYENALREMTAEDG